jgi:hypothetical protein
MYILLYNGLDSIFTIKGWFAEVLLDIGSKLDPVNGPDPVPPGKPPKLIFKSQIVGANRLFRSHVK